LRNRILFLLTFCALIVSASAQSDFNRFNFTAGGGLGIGRHDVANFVGNSYFEVAGGGVNFSRMFGVDAEYMHYDLGFRPSVTLPANLNHQSGNMQSISLDGIVTVPRHYGKLGAYGIFGIGFYHRSVSADRQLIGPPTEPGWKWWDPKYDAYGNLLPQYISSNSKDAGGFNYGGGVTYRLNHLHNSKLYIEYRYHRAYHSDSQAIVVPITVGLRW
jgi:Outer membrane protein beta-barrel domain